MSWNSNGGALETSSAVRPARLIIDPPASGTWNMAVDEALLRTAATTGRISLRIYGWAEPTLSLGYFQSYAARHTHAASQICPVVRRASGGGALIHDQELTYSLTAPVRPGQDRRPEFWYEQLHSAWIDTLARSGITAELCPATDPAREDRFLCFDRRARGDLVLKRAKIGGSAQRRHQRAVLQHGSLLLTRSEAAPELPGIAQLTGREASGAWARQWAQLLGARLKLDWDCAGLSPPEAETAKGLQNEKFGNPKWTHRR